MRKSVRFWMFSLLAVVALSLAACGGSSGAQLPPPKPAASSSDSGSDSGGEAAPSGVVLELGIKGEELAFDTDTLEATVAEGEDLTIDFENTSQTQEHNLVLLDHNDMDQASEFNDAAMSAVDTSYYPEDDDELTSQVIAHIETKQPGETESITFAAPAPGDYLYICTVPGHFAAGDYGTLTVSAP